MKQTAVDWLKINLPSLFEHDQNGFYKKLFDQAKAMERQQIIDAFEMGWTDLDKMSKQYYTETYQTDDQGTD